MKKQILFENKGTSYRADGDDIDNPKIDNELPAAAVIPDGDAALAADVARMIGELMGGRELKRRPGITVCGYFFSAELILMAAMFIASVVMIHRITK